MINHSIITAHRNRTKYTAVRSRLAFWWKTILTYNVCRLRAQDGTEEEETKKNRSQAQIKYLHLWSRGSLENEFGARLMTANQMMGMLRRVENRVDSRIWVGSDIRLWKLLRQRNRTTFQKSRRDLRSAKQMTNAAFAKNSGSVSDEALMTCRLDGDDLDTFWDRNQT